jgi:TRAP-type C4-dicarboxylate transport system permease small subunit
MRQGLTVTTGDGSPPGREAASGIAAPEKTTPRRVLDFIYRMTGALSAICIFLIFALMIVASLARQFNVVISGANDIVAWLCAAAAFFALADSFKHGDFVRVTLLLQTASPPVRRAFELGSLTIAAVVVGYLTWWATVYTYESYVFQDMSIGMVAIPIWIPQISFGIGSWLLLIAVVDELWIVLRGGKPSYEVAVEERHAKGDFSSDI